jgi:photosystem II stability/assembly factor-like uncharacterized protein
MIQANVNMAFIILLASSSVALSQKSSVEPSRQLDSKQTIIHEMASRVSRDSVLAMIRSLGSFQTRFEYTPQQDSAAELLVQTMSRWGSVTSEWYSFGLLAISDIEPVTGSRAWCAVEGRLYRTTNGGGTWSADWTVQSDARVLDFVDADHGWIAGKNGSIAMTTNGSLPHPAWTTQTSGTSSTFNAIRFLDTKVGIAVGTSRTIRRTTNGGSTWSASIVDSAASSLNGVSIVDCAHAWIVGDGGTILSSSDTGTTWSTQASGSSEALYGVKFLNADVGWAVGYGSTLLRTTNGGADWQRTTLPAAGTGSLRCIDFADATHGWIADYRSPVVYRTTDGGSAWEASNVNWGSNSTCVRARSPDELYLCGTKAALRKSTDGGVTWMNQTPNLPGDIRHLTRNIVLTIPGTTSPEEECVMLAHYDSYSRVAPEQLAPGANDNASGSSAVLEAARIMPAYAFGKTVKLLLVSAEELGLLGSNAFVERALAENRNVVCAVNADMIGRPVTIDTASLTVSSFMTWSRFIDSAVVYNGRYGIGLLLTTMIDGAGRSDHVPFSVAGFDAITFGGGADPDYHSATDTWEKIDPDLIRKGAQLMLATLAELAEPQGNSGTVDPFGTLPVVSTLKPNYPNPFNHSTTIEFDLAGYQRVTIEVFDPLGRQVDVVMDQHSGAGTHRVRWDAGNRASGVYYLHFRAGTRVETRPMLLLR